MIWPLCAISFNTRTCHEPLQVPSHPPRDLDRAKWFARRWGANGPIWEATVTTNDVIGYYDGRGEKEVVAVYDHIVHLIYPYNE